MNMRYFSRACGDTFAASHTFLNVDYDGAGVFVYPKSFELASFNARVIFTLSAKMRKLDSWDQHENADPRRFRPNLVFVGK